MLLDEINWQCTPAQLRVKRRSIRKWLKIQYLEWLENQKSKSSQSRMRPGKGRKGQLAQQVNGAQDGTRLKNILERAEARQQNTRAVFTYKGVDHIALVTRRLAAMKTFYIENLGMTLEFEGKAKAGYNVVTLRAGESLIDLFEASPTNPAPTANLSEEHICLSATGSSIYDVIAIFKRKKMDPSPAEVNNGSKGKGLSTWVRDPDGHKIEIKMD
jgi:catechol 2,3-dioxygenase-like lactoylglutathione lyase family enzyme